jgi:hypothetical protein
MTFEEEVLYLLRPAEWRDDPSQAAEDFYDLMGDAEDNTTRKLFLLRSLRNRASEMTLRTYTLYITPLIQVFRVMRIDASWQRYEIGLLRGLKLNRMMF